MSDYSSSSSGSGGDAELQEFLMAEKQKAQVNSQVSCYLILLQLMCSVLLRFPLQCIFPIDSWIQWNLLGQMYRPAKRQARQQDWNMSNELCGSLHRYFVASNQSVCTTSAEKWNVNQRIHLRWVAFKLNN